MLVFMMGIVSVTMLVHYDFVNVLVPVLLSQMQPKSKAHQAARNN